MEQKTEASQAVDEPVLPHLPRAVGYRHTMDNTEGLKGNKPVVVFGATKPNPFGIPGLDYSASFPVTTETLFTANQMKAYARAALNAHPAPTEAAQGEDSARLSIPVSAYLWLMGAGGDAFAQPLRPGAFWWRDTFNQLAGVDMMEIIKQDRARASAETGGVKS